MAYDPRKCHRHSIRLDGYDYTQAGACFVTICTAQRAELLGEVLDGGVNLNAFGRIVRAEWERLHAPLSRYFLDAFVVMPNRIHGVIIVGATSPRRGGATAGRPYE